MAHLGSGAQVRWELWLRLRVREIALHLLGSKAQARDRRRLLDFYHCLASTACAVRDIVPTDRELMSVSRLTSRLLAV